MRGDHPSGPAPAPLGHAPGTQARPPGPYGPKLTPKACASLVHGTSFTDEPEEVVEGWLFARDMSRAWMPGYGICTHESETPGPADRNQDETRRGDRPWSGAEDWLPLCAPVSMELLGA